jgi:hypothetical protein
MNNSNNNQSQIINSKIYIDCTNEELRLELAYEAENLQLEQKRKREALFSRSNIIQLIISLLTILAYTYYNEVNGFNIILAFISIIATLSLLSLIGAIQGWRTKTPFEIYTNSKINEIQLILQSR